MQKLIDEIKKTGGDMACRGRAESNSGAEQTLSDIQLRAIAANLKCPLDETILGG